MAHQCGFRVHLQVLKCELIGLGYELQTGRILLDGEDPVSIHATGVELEAKSVDYTPGQDNTIGSLMAVGPGWLRAMDEKQLAD